MRHIYNGEEGDFTDLTVGIPEQPPKAAAAASLESSNLAALPPRCVFSCLTQNMCVGESREIRSRVIEGGQTSQIFF